MIIIKSVLLSGIFLITVNYQLCPIVQGQRTILDPLFSQFWQPTYDYFERNQDLKEIPMKLQPEIQMSVPFFCNLTNSPGNRSPIQPNTVHQLRPGDIDVIAAMGDSLTAGNGMTATQPLDILVQNRGMSWSIGGQDTWRKYITLPNILKMFNPALYGYSLQNGLSIQRSSKFNVAEPGGMSRDMPYQAQVLHIRLKKDPNVNMTNDWKLLTLMIGGNDLCSDICFQYKPINAPAKHAQNLLRTLRYLRDNIPRLIVNLVPAPDVRRLFELNKFSCLITHRFLCGCYFVQSQKSSRFYDRILADWFVKEKEIVDRDEFNTNTFTVNYQPFIKTFDIPRLPNQEIDYSYSSADCFHLSQKSHAFVSMGLWNNMLEPEGSKTPTYVIGTPLKCPTETEPYFYTRENSKKLN